MRKLKARIIAGVAILFVLPVAFLGCSAGQEAARQRVPQFVKMQTKLDYSEHEPYAGPGENSISGQAFLTQPGDAIVTCSGSRVLLLPATPYFREMIGHMVAGSEPLPPERSYPGLKGMIRRAECDAQGHFSFRELPDGRWFVLTEVKTKTGGVLITEMTLPHHNTTEILLTNKHLVGR